LFKEQLQSTTYPYKVFTTIVNRQSVISTSVTSFPHRIPPISNLWAGILCESKSSSFPAKNPPYPSPSKIRSIVLRFLLMGCLGCFLRLHPGRLVNGQCQFSVIPPPQIIHTSLYNVHPWPCISIYRSSPRRFSYFDIRLQCIFIVLYRFRGQDLDSFGVA